ncbi:protein ninH [Staphylococcus aureus]|nr:protein ninH [Staphylococcus aureus]
MTFPVTTLPDMLVETYVNPPEGARILKCSLVTLSKYVYDTTGQTPDHALITL